MAPDFTTEQDEGRRVCYASTHYKSKFNQLKLIEKEIEPAKGRNEKNIRYEA